ncbi:MAG TPA: hypothetical protein VLZ77_14945 [Acidimicrobiales bacterium]|nr:hypothetical protein [Acidimicrobiales bacterium]
MASRYRRGYTGRDYHVTGGHEAEAEAAQRAKDPTRLGLFVLRLLGFGGTVRRERPRGASSPRHQHPRHPDAT